MTQKLSIRDVVESTSSNPYFSGYIEIQADAHGAKLRWEGETQWHEVEWYELLIIAGSPGRFQEALDELKTQTIEQAYKEVIEEHIKDEQGMYWKAFQDGLAAGKKVIELKVREGN